MAYARNKSAKTASRGDRDEFTTLLLQRSEDAFGFDTEQRKRAISDMRFAFVAGNQWDEHLTKKRKNKPCYEFNRIRQLIRRVTGQQLKNKPQLKVRAVEDNDVDTAEILNGLIKNIEVQSSAENAYDTAFQWACGGGYGVLRVVAHYDGDDTFDQCLKIKTVMDPFTVWCDPAAREIDRSDARYWLITEIIPLSVFKKRWPNADVVDFSASIDTYDRGWWFEDTVRIAEYWYKEEETHVLYQLSDGTVVDAEEFDPIKDEAANPPLDETGQPTREALTIKNTREVQKDCIYSCLVSGKGQLEKPTKWGGSLFPIIPQWGDLISIDGKQIYSGMTRFGRDAQTIHNFEMSSMVEVVAKLPNNPLMATAKQIEGLESYYERLGYDDPPVLLYNMDGDAPAPMRQPMAQLPSAQANLSAIATDELKADMGVYDASVGNRSNETSGRAILARQNEGDIANFVYVDNQMKALKRLGDVLVDAIPHYYDAERSIRILGEDNAEKYIQINRPTIDEQTGEVVIINDLSRGKYDVTVTVGKSFDTSRMEIAELAQALSQTPGPIGALGQFLMINNLDAPGMTEIVAAARKVLVTQGLLEPGEKDQPPAPPPPNPKDVADAKLKGAQTTKAEAEAEKIATETQRMMALDALQFAPAPQYEQSHNDDQARQWLDQAIAMHERHMSGQAPTTGAEGERSQMQLMQQLQAARSALGPEPPASDQYMDMDMGSMQSTEPPQGGFSLPDSGPAPGGFPG